MPADRGSFAAIVQWTLVAVGVGCLGTYLWVSREISQREYENRAAVARVLAEGTARTAEAPPSVPEPRDAGVIGALEIPRLHLSEAVLNGADAFVLAAAVGHLPDTPLPWEAGNTALAGHRDRSFRALEHIRIGDEIRLSTRHGEFDYRVVRTMIVAPRDIWVLNEGPNVDLTLITCYPFWYAGHAPQRFIVRAQRVEMSP